MGRPFWRLSWAVKDPEKLENVPGGLWALELGLPDVVAGAPEKMEGLASVWSAGRHGSLTH
jgi:hypothetical protein